MVQKIILFILLVITTTIGYKFIHLKEENKDLYLQIEQLESILKMQIEKQKDNYSEYAIDVNGNSPNDIINEYMEAKLSSNFKKMYELLEVPEDISYESFVKDFQNDPSRIIQYKVEDYLLTSDSNAAVFITYKIRMENNKTSTYNWEPWACIKVNGVWKVRWLPRQ
jgi:hypothetical protein